MAIGSAAGLLVGVGVGGAAAKALEPDFVDVLQNSWNDNRNLVLEPDVLARLVAQGGVDLSEGAKQAGYSGINHRRFHDLVYLEEQVPGTAQLLFLWRLGHITQEEWRFGMTKLGYRADFIARVAKTFTVPLTAEQVAIALQRTLIPNQGQLPFSTDIPAGKVQPMPVVDLDGYASAAAYGVSKGQLDVLTRAVGLPPGMDLVARLVFRQVLEKHDFIRAAAESNRRQEWAEFEFEGYREILTSHQACELQLRGYLTRDERLHFTRNHGMPDHQSDLLYDVLGRSINVHQIVTGEARGGTYKPAPATFAEQTAGIPPAFLASLERGNLRPEYYSLAYANKYNYPSAFVTRALLQAGAITESEGEQIFLDIGWKPSLATKVAKHYGAAGVAKADPHVTKADNQLWTAQHSAYVKDRSDDAFATATLTEIGVAASAIPTVLERWKRERAIHRAGLSAAQIKKAYSEAKFTKDEATARLVELGWSAADAAVYLGE